MKNLGDFLPEQPSIEEAKKRQEELNIPQGSNFLTRLEKTGKLLGSEEERIAETLKAFEDAGISVEHSDKPSVEDSVWEGLKIEGVQPYDIERASFKTLQEKMEKFTPDQIFQLARVAAVAAQLGNTGILFSQVGFGKDGKVHLKIDGRPGKQNLQDVQKTYCLNKNGGVAGSFNLQEFVGVLLLGNPEAVLEGINDPSIPEISKANKMTFLNDVSFMAKQLGIKVQQGHQR